MDWYVGGFWLVLAALTLLAWAWRDRRADGRTVWRTPELVVPTLYWTAALLTVLVRPSVATRFVSIERALLLIDCGLFAALAWTAVRFSKVWVSCAAAFQLISTTAHVARLVTPSMWRLAYQVMEEASSYPALAALASGLAAHRITTRRRRRSSASSAFRLPPPILKD